MQRRLLLGLLALAVLGGVLLGLDPQRQPESTAMAGDPDTVLQGILRRQGLGTALDSLAARAARDSTVRRDGHQLAHALGREAVTAHGGDAAVIRECRPHFASGCYHGVIEASLSTAGRLGVQGLERLCLAVQKSSGPGAGFECLHGLGHGLLHARGHELEAALRDCDSLSTTRWAASCHKGFFMEAINITGHEHSEGSAIPIDAADPYSPCRAYGDPYATSCWLFQGFLILRANGFDAGRALKVCDGAPDRRAARCYESVGHQLTGLFQRDDRWVLDQCAQGRLTLAAHCGAGAALALVAMDWSGSRAARFCTVAAKPWKESCYRSASDALVDVAPSDQRARFCGGIEPAYVEDCRRAGELLSTRAPR